MEERMNETVSLEMLNEKIDSLKKYVDERLCDAMIYIKPELEEQRKAIDRSLAIQRVRIDELNEFMRINEINFHLNEDIKNVTTSLFLGSSFSKFIQLDTHTKVRLTNYGTMDIYVDNYAVKLYLVPDYRTEWEVHVSHKYSEDIDKRQIVKFMMEHCPSNFENNALFWFFKNGSAIELFREHGTSPPTNNWILTYNSNRLEAAFDPNLSIMENVRRTFVPMINETS